jgi:hypothetical protein
MMSFLEEGNLGLIYYDVFFRGGKFWFDIL